MNTLESCTIVSPKNNNDECAKFIIDDIGSPFILSDIMEIGTRYTFSFWIRSEANSSIQTASSTFLSSTEWQKHSIVFTAASKDLSIVFLNAGEYYIYHPKLELGNMVTDWSPAPEDLDNSDKLAETNERVQNVYKLASDLDIKVNGINATVSESKTTINEISGEIDIVASDIASLKLNSENFTVEIQNITDNGVKKVTTTTGVFDNEGLTIDKSDSPTKSQLTPDGLTVYKKDADGNQDDVLKATSDGVDATNLHANTYLIIGGRSRFENYGTNRTGCFWIGG